MSDVLSKLIVGKKEAVQDDYLLLDPTQVPILSAIGFASPIKNTNYEWVEDGMFATQSCVNGAVADSGTSIVVDDTEPFTKDSVARIGEELVLISAVNDASKTLTCVRGYNGTTAAAISDDEIIEYLFVDSVEGQEARDARAKQRVKKNNYTQIFTDTIEVSGTVQELDQYGVVSEYERRRVKRQTELFLSLEKALVQGIKYESVDGAKRFMGGVKQFLTTNISDAGGSDVSLAMLKDMTREVNLAGGFKSGKASYNFHMHPSMVSKVSDLMVSDNGSQMREDTVRGYTVNFIQTDDGIFPVISNNNLKTDEILFLDHSRMSVHPLGKRSMFHEYLGKTGDTYKGMVLGEYSFKFEEEKAHARLKNIK